MSTPTVRVALVGPPLEASGGIGRVMGYVVDALDDPAVKLEVLDSRGLSQSPWLSALPLARTCAALARRKIARSLDVVHVNVSSHGSALRKGVVVRLCRALRIPVVLHLHASSFPDFFDALPVRAQAWVRRTFGAADRVVVLGPVWRDYVCQILGVAERSVTVLPNATPPASPAPVRRPKQPLELLFLGRLGERKGLPELFAALDDPRLRACDWRLTLAGDGDVDHYVARAASAGLTERTTFTGWVSPREVADLLQRAHVLVLPSRAEGLPMSVLEAFAASVPVVCTPVGALDEVAADGVNALVVPPGDAGALAEAFVRLAHDEDLRERLARGAGRSWSAHFAMGPYVARLVEEWREAARAPRGARPRGHETRTSA